MECGLLPPASDTLRSCFNILQHCDDDDDNEEEKTEEKEEEEEEEEE